MAFPNIDPQWGQMGLVTNAGPIADRRHGTFGLFLIPALIVAAGYAAQAQTVLNHDVGWVLYSTGMLLHGAVYGKDIIEPNPPLIWWISATPVFLAQHFALPIWVVFRLFVTLITMTCLFVSDRIIVAGGATRATRATFLIAGAYLFTVAVGRDFGQREHLAAVLVLPYVFSIARRMHCETLRTDSALAIGATAGLALALKPYFIGVPLLLEVLLLWRTRSLRNLIRPEALGGVLAVGLYAAAVAVFAYPWLVSAAPDIWRVYWAFEVSASGLLLPLITKFFPVIVGAFVIVRMRANDFGIALIAASIGFAAAAILQGKYYSYHVFPAYALLVLALAVSLNSLIGRLRILIAVLLTVILMRDVTFSAESLIIRSDRGAIGREYFSMARFVQSNTPVQGSFLAISTHPYPGFPTALYAGRRWSSASNSQIFLPAVVRLRQQGPSADAQLLSFAESKAREAIRRDLAHRPELVLIDQRPLRHAIGQTKFDYLEFFMEDAAFRSIWRDYVPAANPPRGFAAYARSDAANRR